MILDTLNNGRLYNAMNPRFAKVFEYLKGMDLKALPAGRHEIDGQNIFMNVMDDLYLRPEREAVLEAHDKYTDIQLVISGRETYGWRDRNKCASVRGEMDPQKDLVFFDDGPSNYFTLGEGQIAIFFPDDAHAPFIGEGKVKKVIIKVAR